LRLPSVPQVWSAIATAMVSARTSKPVNRILDMRPTPSCAALRPGWAVPPATGHKPSKRERGNRTLAQRVQSATYRCDIPLVTTFATVATDPCPISSDGPPIIPCHNRAPQRSRYAPCSEQVLPCMGRPNKVKTPWRLRLLVCPRLAVRPTELWRRRPLLPLLRPAPTLWRQPRLFPGTTFRTMRTWMIVRRTKQYMLSRENLSTNKSHRKPARTAGER
jgi:hypothetical protein